LWQQREIASEEFANRKELDFPPALRLASIQGEKSAAVEVIRHIDSGKYQILGPISLKSDKADIDHRYVIKYQYSQGATLATELKASIAKLSSGSVRLGTNGRSSRAIRVRMDDPEVI
jgi:primosomal protein N' (replication factor Y)